MMASDSDESDYEDTRQHHDNVATESPNPPIASNTENSSGNQSQNISNQPRSNAENSSRDNRQNHEENNQNQAQEPTSGEPDRLEIAHEENQPIIVPAQDNHPEQVHANAANANDLVVEVIRGDPIVVVDSDEDDMEIISDSDDLEFPLLNDDEDGERAGGASSDDNEGAHGDVDDELQEFDQQLPIRHSYLGEGMEELQGRIVLEEDATPEIPLIAMGIHLIPGQTLPLTIFHAVFQNAIRRCVLSDRLFGIVYNEMDLPSANVVYKGALGTLAEIFEYQEESDDVRPGYGAMSSSFALKAKGRQRFNILEVRRQADGNLMGRVRIRPEIKLEPFVLNLLLPSASRCYLPIVVMGEPDEEEETSPPTWVPTSISERVGRRDSVASTMSTATTSTQLDKDLPLLQSKIKEQRKRLKYYAALTSQPYFVYEQYDETVLVEKVHKLLKTELKGITESRGKIPTDASDLSFWLAQNLTMDDSHRTKILRMDSPIQRLRYELELLARTTKVISCRSCQANIADHSQIFSMSIEGPQGTYVNPHGFVHETLTVHKAKELITRGSPSTEASWFPGYSWTIVECRRCKVHIGWKFQAVGKLKPARFWGLARRSVIFKYDFGSDSDIQESLESHRTPPNSANSEAFATVALF